MITFSFMGKKEADAFLSKVGIAKRKGEADKIAIIFHHLDGARTPAEFSELTGISEEMIRKHVKEINTESEGGIKLERNPRSIKRENFGH